MTSKLSSLFVKKKVYEHFVNFDHRQLYNRYFVQTGFKLLLFLYIFSRSFTMSLQRIICNTKVQLKYSIHVHEIIPCLLDRYCHCFDSAEKSVFARGYRQIIQDMTSQWKDNGMTSHYSPCITSRYCLLNGSTVVGL